MEPKRKKSGAPAPESARASNRQIAPGSSGSRAYPSAREALRSEACRALVDRAVRAAAGVGIVALGAQLVGCAEPTCASSRAEELRIHGESAYTSVTEYGDFRSAGEQLGYAMGVVDHPPFHPGMMAGAMIMPAPTLSGGYGGLPGDELDPSDPLALPDEETPLSDSEIVKEYD